MMGARSYLRSTLIWTIAVGGVVFMMSTGLPWLAEHGYAGRVIQENARSDRDASALFYTEDDRVWEVLEALPDDGDRVEAP